MLSYIHFILPFITSSLLSYIHLILLSFVSSLLPVTNSRLCLQFVPCLEHHNRRKKKPHMRTLFVPSFIFLISRFHSICKVLFFVPTPLSLFPLLPPEAAQSASIVHVALLLVGLGGKHTASCICLTTSGRSSHLHTEMPGDQLHPVPKRQSDTDCACPKAVKLDVSNL